MRTRSVFVRSCIRAFLHFLCAAAALLVFGGTPVSAHPPATTEIAVSLNEASGTFDVAITADADGLLLKLEALSGGDVPAAPLPQAQRDARLMALRQTLIDRVEMRFDGTDAPLHLSKMLATDPQTTVFHLGGVIPRGARTATWRTSLIYGSYPFTIRTAGESVGAGGWLQGPEESEPYRVAESASARGRTSLAGFSGLAPFGARIATGLLAVVLVASLLLATRRRRVRGFQALRP